MELRDGGFEKPGWSASDMETKLGKEIQNLKNGALEQPKKVNK